MKQIPITKGTYAIIDDEDFENVSQWRWCWHKGYAFRRMNLGVNKSRLVGMHRFIMGDPKGKEIDHINGNPLDNRRSNLRIVTHRENMQNMKKRRNSTSKYIGVHLYKNGWTAQIWRNGKNIYLGRFKTEKEAFEATKNTS